MTISSARPPPEHLRQRGSVIVLDGSGAQAMVVGGKAAALDRLIGWGVRVPPCAVVTVEAVLVSGVIWVEQVEFTVKYPGYFRPVSASCTFFGYGGEPTQPKNL